MFYIQISCISHLAGIFITIRKSVDECYIFYIYECCIFIAQIRRYTPYRALGQPIRGHGQNNMKGTKILEQKILFYAQLIIVILTFIQSWQNRQTLKEMKTSRTESVSPLLLPELGAKIKG